MNSSHRKTHEAIFASSAPPDLRWSEIETLFLALGGEVSEGAGSRVRVALNGARAVFHRPHPAPTAKRSTVRAVRDFLITAGVRSEG